MLAFACNGNAGNASGDQLVYLPSLMAHIDFVLDFKGHWPSPV